MSRPCCRRRDSREAPDKMAKRHSASMHTQARSWDCEQHLSKQDQGVCRFPCARPELTSQGGVRQFQWNPKSQTSNREWQPNRGISNLYDFHLRSFSPNFSWKRQTSVPVIFIVYRCWKNQEWLLFKVKTSVQLERQSMKNSKSFRPR